MKKGIVVVLLLLALVVIVSPRLVGYLAEKSVDENLNWAADNSGELVVASEGFDRGWFSSQGQHRVELGQGNFRGLVETLIEASDGEKLPALLINTHLDHGLIPVSSIGREGGSLAPGLGSAVSTLVYEAGDGTQIEIPGQILSTVGLSGNVESNYVVDSGTQDVGDGRITWEPSNVQFAVDPKTGNNEFDAKLGALKFESGGEAFGIGKLGFSGQQAPTEYGFPVGEFELSVDALLFQNNDQNTVIKRMAGRAATEVSDNLVNSETTFEISSEFIPGVGEILIEADIGISEADAAAFGALSRALDASPPDAEPTQLLAAADTELKDFLAGGFKLDIEQMDVTLPTGQIESEMHFSVPEADAADFTYSSLLLSAVADVDIVIPEELVTMAMQMNPQVGMVVGMGYLKKNGDRYELDAQMKNGLLTLNGAPIPLPFGAMR